VGLYGRVISPFSVRRGISVNIWQAKERKDFFFEKKKQKTFVIIELVTVTERPTPEHKSFLVLFFKKELLASFLPHSGILYKRLPA
jgi:hypothetical protein